jgi:nucleotide-binding universal stress UspA family protein
MQLLVATGGSAHSDLALQMSVQLAYLSQKTSTILTVIRNPEDRQRAEEVQRRARAQFEAEGIEVNAIIRVGQPELSILHEVIDGDYDLLVLGDRQLHRISTRLRGSVSERLARQAPCAVLIVKGMVRPIRRVLLCDSGVVEPPLRQRFLAEGLGRLLEHEVDVTVLHVMSQISAGPGINGAQLRADADELIRNHSPEGELLAEDVRSLAPVAGRTRPKVRHGFVVDEIMAEAREGDYDLVVIGAHREHGWQRFLLDDIAHEIITQIDRHLLVIP